MVAQFSSYENYVRGIRGLLLFAGLWPGKKYDNLAYRLLPLIDAFVCFTMSCVVLNFCREHSNNLDLVTKSIGIMVSFLSAVLKVVCFLANHEDLVDLHRTLEKYFEETRLANEDVRIAIFDPLGIFVKPFFAITTLLSIITVVLILAPLILIFVQLSREVRPLNFILPYPGKYPWSFEGGGIVYWAQYVWEVMGALYLLCVTSGVDSLFGYYVFQIHAIFRLISHRMRNLESTDENRQFVLRDCVTKHRILTKCCDQLQIIYGPIVFWISITSAMIMCTQVFQASQARELTLRYAIFTAAYICLKLLQALMYGWYGSVIFTESEEFREAIYSCGWPGSGDKSLMNNVLIMLCHKPIVLTACKFLIISTDMFAAILNATISYFFLLQTLDEEK